MTEGYVWVVHSLADDTPTMLSVHTDKELAFDARDAYMTEGKLGNTEDAYWVQGVLLNWTGEKS